MNQSLFSITVIAVGALFTSCGNNISSGDNNPRSVLVAKPVAANPEGSIRLPGIINETHEINLGFKTPGQIKTILAKEGDYVKQGQLLATLDDVDYALAVEALKVQHDQLQQEINRTTQLHEQKSISDNDYEKALAGLKQLEVQLQANQNKLDYTRLYSPVNGYIGSVNYSASEMVDAGMAVFTLIDVSRLEVVADLAVSDYMRRHDFTGFHGQVSQASDVKIPLTLLSITPKADNNQLYQIKLIADKSYTQKLTPGLNIELTITTLDPASANTDNSVIVPARAIAYDNTKPFVWVVSSDSIASKREVSVGAITSDGDITITNGLTADDIIIVAGINSLCDGQKVKVADKSTPTNVGGLL